MAAVPSSSLAQQPRSEAAAASQGGRGRHRAKFLVAPETSHGPPIGKMATKASQDVVPDQAAETSSTPAGPARREDTVASKDGDQRNAMDVVTGSVKRALEDPPSGGGEAGLRHLERE
ncbi:unnamed protein product [Ixodes pacificus]